MLPTLSELDSDAGFNAAAAKYAELHLWIDGEGDGEDGAVLLDANYKRVFVGQKGEGGRRSCWLWVRLVAVDGAQVTPPQKRGWQPSSKHTIIV